MMKRFIIAAASLTLLASIALAGEVKLVEPQKTDGMGIFEALSKRASGKSNAFPTGKLSQQDLSTILWSASGMNRPGKGWTVPMGMGTPPYCKIYVASDEGVFLYSWNDHSLKEISKENIKAGINSQPFMPQVSHVLIFTTDGAELAKVKRPQETRDDWANILAGAMTQNVYLAAESLGISGRFMVSMNVDFVRSKLGLRADDKQICIMPLAKR